MSTRHRPLMAAGTARRAPRRPFPPDALRGISRHSPRPGSTFLEVQVAALVFGIVLSGLAPLMVINVRQATALRDAIPDGDPLYLAPVDSWQAKLGGGASVSDAPATADPAQWVVDDGNMGYTDQAYYVYQYAWPSAYAADFRLLYSGSGYYGQWSLNVTPGYYQVHVTFPAFAFLSNDARYSVFDNFSSRGTVAVNQQLAPGDLSADGVQWKLLGTYLISSGSLRVRLRGGVSSQWLSLDALRATPVLNTVELLQVEKDRDARTLTVRANVTP